MARSFRLRSAVASLTSASFWIDVAERAVRSFAQGTLAAMGVGAANSVQPGLTVSVPWHVALVAGCVMGVLSVLSSLASTPVTTSDPYTGSFLAAPPNQAEHVRSFCSFGRS
jgi:hypothetical protein